MRARLVQFFDLRPGEALPVLLTFTYVALVVASFLLAKPVRNALFLQQYGAYNLASVYVAVPVVLLLFVPLYARLIARRGHRRVISATLVFFALNAIAFWYGFAYHPAPWLTAAFYIWVNCYAAITPVQAWAFAASIFDTRQARRLFGLIGGGASLGAIMGGLMARTLVAPLGGAVNLILLMAGLMAAAAALVNGSRWIMWRRPSVPATRQHRVPFAESLGLITRTPYLRLVVVLVVLVAIATQWVSFQFSLAAEQRYGGDADRLTSFFGAFNFYLGVLAFLLQLFVTGPVLRQFGIAFAILLLPAALGFASVLIVLMPELWTVLVAASFDQALRFSTDKSSYELLYLPIAPGLRSNVKATIDMIVSRVADAAGGVLLGLATGGLGPFPGVGLGLRGTAGVNVALITLWTGIAFAVRRGYVLAIQDSIRQHRLDAERATELVLDRSTAALVEAKLAAEDPEEVLYALSFFESGRVPLHPAVRFLLDHEQPEIRRKALVVLRTAGDRPALAKAERMLADPDLETRTEALLFLAQHAGVDPLQRIEQLGDFPDFSIQAGVIAFLTHPGPTQNLEAATTMLDAMIEDRGGPAVRGRTEAARLLAFLPADFSHQLARLVGDENTEAARQALRAVARRRAWRCADAVVGRLGHPELTEEAVEALATMADRSIGPLRGRLLDSTAPAEIRREIPEVLVQIGSAAAHQALMEALLDRDGTVRLRVIAALNKLHQSHPELPVDRRMAETALAAEVIGHYRSYQALGALGDGLRDDDPIVAGLRQSMDREVELIFQFMDLLFPDEDLQSAYVGLRSENPAIRANALEFLDHVVRPPQLRRLILPLLDSQAGVAERARLGERLLGTGLETREEAVAALLASDDPWLKACAVHAIGVLGLTSLAQTLEDALKQSDPLLRELARTAKQRLAGEVLVPIPGGEEAEEEWRKADAPGMG